MNQTASTTPVARAHTDVAVGLYGAVARGDLDAAVDYLADDVVLHVPGSHPLAGDHRGRAGFQRFLADSRSLTEAGEQVELIDLMQGRDHVAVYCRVRAERAGRPPLDNTTVHVLRIDNGRVAEAWFHNWDDASVARFWS
jgi:ketosteroid isomerase-like protein